MSDPVLNALVSEGAPLSRDDDPLFAAINKVRETGAATTSDTDDDDDMNELAGAEDAQLDDDEGSDDDEGADGMSDAGDEDDSEDDDAAGDSPDADDADEEDGDSQGEAKPKGKQPKLTVVEVPNPNADGSKGDRGTGTYTLEGVPQEAADSIRYHINRSERVDDLEATVEQLQGAADIADFVERDPFHAMLILGQSRPDETRQFVREMVRMNPTLLDEIADELELADLTPREQKLMAAAAKRDAEAAVQKAANQHRTASQQRRAITELSRTIEQVARTAGMDGDDREVFYAAAVRKVSKLREENPSLTSRDVVTAIQPLVAKFATQAARGGKQDKPSTPKDAQKRFKVRAEKTKKYRVVGSGKSRSPLTEGSAIKKPKKGTVLTDAIKDLRAGKLGFN